MSVTVGLLAACTGGGSGASEENTAPPVGLRIAPEDGGSDLRPDSPITVTASNGTIDAVTATAHPITTGEDGEEPESITGDLNEKRTEWRNDGALPPGTEITVTATATGVTGETTEATSEFSTFVLEEEQRLRIESNFPNGGQRVGVGMPVILDFDRPVADKERVEQAIEVVSEEPAQGAWNWFGDRKAVFRTAEYWEPHQEVTVDARLAGVPAAEDVYGVENTRWSFEVGRSQITTVDDTAHRMVIERDGERIKDYPISNGDATKTAYTTTSGTHLLMDKHRHLVMDSATVGIPPGHPEYYRVDAYWAVRFTNSGMFTHAAPWNNRLGRSNESHGCTNMSTAAAKWFYKNSLMGDPYIVTGTDRELEVDNGWGYWQRSWEEWLEHSESGTARRTGEPDASRAPTLEADEATPEEPEAA